MVKLKVQKIKSATLIETIIALIIILALTGITVTVFVQLTVSGYSMQKIRAKSVVDHYIAETKARNSFFDEQIQEREFIIRKEVVTGEVSRNLFRLRFSVLDQNGNLIRVQNLYLLKQ